MALGPYKIQVLGKKLGCSEKSGTPPPGSHRPAENTDAKSF